MDNLLNYTYSNKYIEKDGVPYDIFKITHIVINIAM